MYKTYKQINKQIQHKYNQDQRVANDQFSKKTSDVLFDIYPEILP